MMYMMYAVRKCVVTALPAVIVCAAIVYPAAGFALSADCPVPSDADPRPVPAGINPNGPLAKLGYLDVTLYGAVPDDWTDDTAAIQNAINDAYMHKMVTYFPSGEYVVSDTLHMRRCHDIQTGHRVRLGHQLVGPGSGPRPAIRLAPNSPGFGDPNVNKKPVIWAWTAACENGAGQVGPCGNAHQVPLGDRPDLQRGEQNYNQVIRGIDIKLGGTPGGNAGATGIRMRSAEGSAIQDVTINAWGGFAGLHSLPGSGGSVTNVEVNGGEYGIYGSETGSLPVLAGLSLQWQNHRAIWYNGLTPFTIVGFDIRKNNGPAIEIVNNSSSHARAHPSLIDGRIQLSNDGDPIIDNAPPASWQDDRNVYLENVYTLGASTVVNNAQGPWLTVNDPDQWSKVTEYAYAPAHVYVDETKIINGLKTDAVQEEVTTPSGSPPADLVSRHVYDDAVWADPLDPDVLVVDDFGAVGDGVADDTAAIRAAIQQANNAGTHKVLLPRGNYRVSGAIDLIGNTKLFGVASDKSRLQPKGWQAGVKTPVVRSAHWAGSTNVLANLKIELYGTGNQVFAIRWRTGRNSVVNGVWPMWHSQNPSADTLERVIISGNGGGRWYNLQNGNGSGTSADANRAVFITGTTEPLAFYMFHSQHVQGKAISEVRNSSNVTFYGVKTETHWPPPDQSETDWPIALLIDNSSNVAVYGYSGLGEQRAGAGLIEILNSTDFTVTNAAKWGANAYPPSGWYYVKVTTSGASLGITADTPANLVRDGRAWD